MHQMISDVDIERQVRDEALALVKEGLRFVSCDERQMVVALANHGDWRRAVSRFNSVNGSGASVRRIVDCGRSS